VNSTNKNYRTTSKFYSIKNWSTNQQL